MHPGASTLPQCWLCAMSLSSPSNYTFGSHFIEMLATSHDAPAFTLSLLLKLVSQAVHFLVQDLELLLFLG